MVHKLRNRDVCQTSPRPNQMRSNFERNVVHSTPDYKKILKPRNVISHRSVLVDLSNVERASTVRLNQGEEELSNNVSTIINDLNSSKPNIKLHKLIDEYIFSHTFGKRGGVSLYAIKKSLREEQPYNSNRTSRNVSRYIALSIKTGRFQQITGQGAAGTFRLNRSIHNNHRLRRLRKVSLMSRTIQRQTSIRQAKHNTIL
ncbi:uncharacterized protein LOC105214335 [Zeugodacus cucurbitae]|uniref:uncharacterized protein LOC105214335 n=1 Tax=Zeugodacus cucurbitae TaxID=28588 RepID=UPI0005969487|nr:uncharacterized protein LOC105214335 [Zeugodacus cucurbitae]